MNQPASTAAARTAPCPICGCIYYGDSILDAIRQHDLVEAHPLLASRVNGEWTASVFVVITDDATGEPITDISVVATLLASRLGMEVYPFEIEGEDAASGGWLVTLDADDYATASEEGGLDISYNGYNIQIPMH